jgi:thiol-disulfide isomerase/thioredoxin
MAFWNQTLSIGPLALPLLFLLLFGTYGVFAVLTLNFPSSHRKALSSLLSIGLVGGYLFSRLVLLVASWETVAANPILILMNIGNSWAWGLGIVLGIPLGLLLDREKVDWQPYGLSLAFKSGVSLLVGILIFVGMPLFFPEPESRTLPPLASLNGEDYSLTQGPYETVVLNFWASWCGPCEIEIPEIKAYLDRNPQDIPRFLGVNATSTEKMVQDVQDFVSRLEIPFPVLLDEKSDWQEEFRITSLPTSLLINRQGQVLNRKVGILSQDTLDSWMKFQPESDD